MSMRPGARTASPKSTVRHFGSARDAREAISAMVLPSMRSNGSLTASTGISSVLAVIASIETFYYGEIQGNVSRDIVSESAINAANIVVVQFGNRGTCECGTVRKPCITTLPGGGAIAIETRFLLGSLRFVRERPTGLRWRPTGP